jgi:hypothetical protein
MTTHSSRGSQARWPPARYHATSRQPTPATSAVASDGRPWRRSGLVGRGPASRQAPPGPGPRPTLPCRPAHDLRSGVRIHASLGRRPSRQGRGRTRWNSIDPVKTAALPSRGLPIASIRLTEDETAVTGRTGGHHTAGRRTGWTPRGRTAASGRGSQMAGHWTSWTSDGWTPGPWTAGRVGWTPSSGDTAWRWTADRRLGSPTTATRTLPLGCCPQAPLVVGVRWGVCW